MGRLKARTAKGVKRELGLVAARTASFCLILGGLVALSRSLSHGRRHHSQGHKSHYDKSYESIPEFRHGFLNRELLIFTVQHINVVVNNYLEGKGSGT